MKTGLGLDHRDTESSADSLIYISVKKVEQSFLLHFLSLFNKYENHLQYASCAIFQYTLMTFGFEIKR